ncbi:ABC transporter ATP-binding protein [Nocardia sp. NPDC059180]|uniref:ABC transporter ATP-binding protein n=1 Tax=Nocardia sp. NPDC059180 TaxID=3346761 RepID=UPI0036AF7335
MAADALPGARALSSRLRAAWRLCWEAGKAITIVHIVCTLVGGVLASVVAWSTKLMIDALVSGEAGPTLIAAVGALVAAGFISACEPRASEYFRSELNRRAYLVMNDRLFTAVGTFHGLGRFESPPILDHIRSAQQSTSNAVGPATTGLFAAARDVVSLIGLLLTVVVIAPPMAVIMLVSAVPVLFAQLALARRFADMLNTMSASSRRQFQLSALNSDVRAVKEIRLLGLVDFFKGRVLAAIGTANDAQRDLDRRQLRTQLSMAIVGSLINGGGIAWAVWAAARGRLTVGDVSAFIAAVAASQAAISGLITRISSAHRALLQLDHYLDVLDMGPDLPSPATPAELPALASGIELVDVWFRYDASHPWVLRGFSARIDHGESLALVGLNGAGKSTLIKLICRFYDPDRGAILWDGVDIRDIPVPQLRRRLGVLFQDFMEYDLTAAENIGVGDLAAGDDEHRIAHAAAAAGVAEKIESLPRGYDTMLSRIFFKETDKGDAEKGVLLSGGQWQRIAIARTLMRADRELLILDEPSSGLDPEAEHQIHRRLETLRAGRTSVLVSHRLSAVRGADRILVLAEGKVVEEGDHESLMALDGQYARLFSRQAQGYLAAHTPS